MFVYDNDLACICEIRPVIDNDILRAILSGFDTLTLNFLKTCPDLATTFWVIVRGDGSYSHVHA
jgi:hypothetical protein